MEWIVGDGCGGIGGECEDKGVSVIGIGGDGMGSGMRVI